MRTQVVLGLLVLCCGRALPGQRWVLVYYGAPNHPRYTYPQVETLLYGDSGQTRRLFDGVVCLELKSPAGRSFISWPTASAPPPGDYDAYLDTLFASHGALAVIDSVAAPRHDTMNVAVMVPFPLGSVHKVPPWDDRITFLANYLARVDSMSRARGFAHLRLWGFYWLLEDVAPGDTLVVQRFNAMVHWHGLRTIWIPYYNAHLGDHWRALGFDVAFLQPNYFFDPRVPATRLDDAMRRATAAGMGLEVEFDYRLLNDTAHAHRLDPYLASMESAAGRRLPGVAVYEGAGAMWTLAKTQDPILQQLYGRLLTLLRSR